MHYLKIPLCEYCVLIITHHQPFDLAVDECTSLGVSHALQQDDCRNLREKEECRGEDKEFCDCCKRAVIVRDFGPIQRDPQACAMFGEQQFSGKCLDVYIHCCTGQGSLLHTFRNYFTYN